MMRAGLDIGGTKIDGVAMSDDGQILARVRVLTGFGADEVSDNAATALALLAEQASAAITSVGVGIPGVIDSERGLIRHAVNLGIEELHLGPELERRTGVATTIENDVNAAALGAHHLLNLSGPIAYLNLGTGLAAGLVIDGQLWRGSRGVSGEIGHIPVDPRGVVCACGQRGCLETIASGSAVARQWPSGHLPPVQSLYQAADAGDPDATRIRRHLADGVAAAVRILILTTDVDTVVIGGGVTHIGTPLLHDIASSLDRSAEKSTFLDSLALASRIRLLPAGLPAAAVGAAMLKPRLRDATIAF